jgi:hypothetical protein
MAHKSKNLCFCSTSHLAAAVAAASFMALQGPVFAQTWQGSTNTDFTIGTNWSGAVAPSVGDFSNS